MSKLSPSKRIGAVCAIFHLAAFVATMVYVYTSAAGQAALVWGIWAVTDFPISLLYLLAGEKYSAMLGGLSGHAELLAHVLYLPHVIHGLLGTIWWFVLPSLVMPRRLGGIWGR